MKIQILIMLYTDGQRAVGEPVNYFGTHADALTYIDLRRINRMTSVVMRTQSSP